MPIQYDLKSIASYTALALTFYAVSLFVKTPFVALNLAIKTLLLAIFVIYLVKKDLPLSSIPVVRKFMKKKEWAYVGYLKTNIQQQRCFRSVRMQGTKIEGEGAYLKYVTESEYRK